MSTRKMGRIQACVIITNATIILIVAKFLGVMTPGAGLSSTQASQDAHACVRTAKQMKIAGAWKLMIKGGWSSLNARCITLIARCAFLYSPQTAH